MIMNLKKLFAISDHFPNCASSRKKVVFGFGLGFVSFFIYLFVLFSKFSFKNPTPNQLFFQGFNIRNNSSLISWSFSFSRTSSSNSTSSSSTRAIFVENATQVEQNPTILISENIAESNGSNMDISLKFLGDFDGKNGSFNGISEKGIDFEDTHLAKLKDDVENATFTAIIAKPNEGKVTIGEKSGNGSNRSVESDGLDLNLDGFSNKGVRESSFKGENGTFETLRVDLMDRTTSMEDYYQEGNHVYPRLKALDAYTRALSTWAKWITNWQACDCRGGQWNSGGQCHKETEPIFNTSQLSKYPSKMRAFDNVMRVMKTPVIYLNISRLTDYRKDGHPSVYRKMYKSLSLKQQIGAEQSQDCSHWCLPGVPDAWNELLYASLLKVGRGSWKS
ncbi:PC-Esterase [Cynara cardunculus var. scolymus]|uniref:PC-Esterase n=1 Tax=Cynara cardunculus var. scolymus TaxID=59895 RepID=A0A103XRI3_CYNCS|nr:PC-Esterase [Cynara cardunculus var. scolymus]